MKKLIAIIALALAATGCTIVDTGKVGLRKNFNNTIEQTELPAGSINQTFVGDVIEFPVRDVSAKVENQTPLSSDNATMKDVDFSIIYSINPSCVSDLYVNKSKTFHAVDDEKDTLLMKTYLEQDVARNAVYKVVRGYEAMTMNDKRAEIEQAVRTTINDTLTGQKLNTCITIGSVSARALTPPDALKQAADELVRAKTTEATKAVEVRTAGLEAARIAALNANKGAISYMDAQTRRIWAEAAAAGKVKAVVVEQGFKGDVHVTD